MTEMPAPEKEEKSLPGHSRHRWNEVGVIIASLVGLLALLVSGYTAYIQRQQVRAEVWPYLTRAWVDPVGVDSSADKLHKMAIFNKGTGPAVVHSVQVSIDGKPQTSWQHVFDALGLSSMDFGYSTLNGNVLSSGETLPALVFQSKSELSRFRLAMTAHASLRICYCSTLGECWQFADHRPRGDPEVQPIAECPLLPPADNFRD